MVDTPSALLIVAFRKRSEAFAQMGYIFSLNLNPLLGNLVL